jgi:hypothetical protein
LKKFSIGLIIMLVSINSFGQSIVNNIYVEFTNFDHTLGHTFETLINEYGFNLSELNNEIGELKLDINMQMRGIPSSEYTDYRVFSIIDMNGMRYTASTGCWILFRNTTVDKIIYVTPYEPVQLFRILRMLFRIEVSTWNNNLMVIDRYMFSFRNIKTIRIERRQFGGYEYSIVYIS